MACGRLLASRSVPSSPLRTCTGILEFARNTPDRLAVTCNGQTLTVGELATRVQSAAATLHAIPRTSAQHLDFLPLFVDRSIESVVAFHAALWAGRRFAPLDPRTPASRLMETIERLGSPPMCAVARPELADMLPERLRAVVTSEPAAVPLDEPLPVDVDGPGYVIFTSGSTGRPKAVVRRWIAYDRWFSPTSEPTPAPRGGPWNVGVLQPLHFGSSHRALVSLGLGYTTHFIDPSTMTARDLLSWFAEHHIQESTLSDTQINSLASAPHAPNELGDLRFVRTGTEATEWNTIARLRHLAAPDVVVAVGYASSEASRAFNLVIGPTDDLGVGRVPLGVPTDPDSVRLEPVPDSPHVQQLVISDPSMFGYLDDPELTAARFVTDAEGRMWWRSGDLAERDHDGIWHHRGRIDDMVKINGMLVEPREAEVVLAAIPGIRAAAVIPHATRDGKWRLVGHLSLDDLSLTPNDVRTALEAHLPRHLVPSILVRHDELPAGERSKLDRPLLRATPLTPWRAVPARTTTNATELWLMGRLTEMLDLADISPDDDLWSLGLDSLGAVEVCAWFADAGFGEIQPPELLEYRTPAALAARLRASAPKGASAAVVLNGDGTRPPWFALPGGGGTALAFAPLAQEVGPEQPIVVLEQFGLHHRGRRDRSINAAARRHLASVRLRQTAGPYVIVGHSWGGLVAQKMAELATLEGDDVRLILLDAARFRRPRSPDLVAVPAAIAERRDPWPIWFAKLSVWRTYRLWRSARRTRLFPRPGTPARYGSFARTARRTSRRHRAAALQVRGALICPVGSGVLSEWDDHPNLHRLTVGGDHYTMVFPPHVSGVVTHIANSIDDARAGCADVQQR